MPLGGVSAPVRSTRRSSGRVPSGPPTLLMFRPQLWFAERETKHGLRNGPFMSGSSGYGHNMQPKQPVCTSYTTRSDGESARLMYDGFKMAMLPSMFSVFYAVTRSQENPHQNLDMEQAFPGAGLRDMEDQCSSCRNHGRATESP